MFKYIRNESGQAMVFVALFLVVLMGFAALAVDVGAMTVQRSKLQNAADAAALAGALVAGNNNDDDDVKDEAENYAVANFKENDTTTINPVIDRGNKTVEVTIKQDIPKYMAGIISNQVKTMNVEAVAKYKVKWGGLALPLFNYSYLYTEEIDGEFKEMVLRVNDKDSPGYKSNLTDFYPVIDDEGNTLYYVEYGDGVQIDEGLGTSSSIDKSIHMKKALEDIFTGVNIGEIFYLLTINSELIERVNNGEALISVTDKHGIKQQRDKLYAGDNIDPEQLVLIQVQYIDRKSENDTYIELKYTGNEYDVINGEVPPNYEGNVNTVTSTLIK